MKMIKLNINKYNQNNQIEKYYQLYKSKPSVEKK
jgi:hypothetical protein